jgi:ribosome-binding protein aMBF1 (putative translation factor)
MITGRQIREARDLLGLKRNRLAAKVGSITTLVILRAEENEDDTLPVAQAIAIRRTLERLGIEFVPDSGSVRLRKQDA